MKLAFKFQGQFFSFLIKKSKPTIVALFIILMSFLVFSGMIQKSDIKPTMAPLSQEFLEFISRPTREIRFTSEGYPLGLIPAPHDVSHLKHQARPMAITTAIPSYYDLRLQNKLTPIKNQGSCGSCWAFATYGSQESFLMPVELLDFSEQHLIDNHGFDYGPCDGGHIYMSAAYLTRWAGPLREADDPYIYALSGEVKEVKHVQDIIFIPPRSNSTDNDLIKQAVMNYGAVYTTMYWDSACYNSAFKSYYNPGNPVGGHAVAIVGWDDNFEASKFNTPPPGNGAFIVRNSWGPNWGDKGYFYVSYYDAYFASDDLNAVIRAENVNNYQVIYQYDELGWVQTWGYNSETAWMANIFQATAAYPLKAVGFYNPNSTASYEIYIYKNVSTGQPRNGELAATKTGTLTMPGYFTITLDQPVPLSANQYFSVVLKLTTPGLRYQICTETKLTNYTSQAVSHPGLSLISYDGINWTDFGSYDPDGDGQGLDVCLKAYAGIEPIYPPLNLRLTRLENNFIFFKEKINRLTWSANLANRVPLANHKIYRKSAGEYNYSLIATIGPSQYYYDDRALKNPDLYSYQVTVVDELGRESDPVSTAAGSGPTVKKSEPRAYRGKIASNYVTNNK